MTEILSLASDRLHPPFNMIVVSMVYHEYKAIQLHIPKTAGTSIENALWHGPNAINRKRTHWRPQQIIATEGQQVWEAYFKFSFVRNPWDRLVSHYFFERDLKKRIPADCDFGQFLSRWGKERSTWNQLVWFEGRLAEFNFVGRFETLNEDFRYICDQLGIDRSLPHDFRMEREHYSVYYDRNTRKQVAKLAKADIKVFGYTFETK